MNTILIICIGIFVVPYAAIGQDKALASPIDTAKVTIQHSFWEQDFMSKNFEPAFNFKSMTPVVFPKYAVTGVFCKMEHRIEATSNFAPRFRLGSVNYTDWMEGKKPFHMRYTK